MIWAVILGMLALVLAALVFLGKVPRAGWEPVGAALLLALAGYAFQGKPDLPAAPRVADEAPAGEGAAAIAARQALSNPAAPGMDGGNHWLITADAMLRHGQFADAANLLRGAVEANPRDSDAWLGIGNALMGHAQGQLSPAALLAYGRAAAADPAAPGPPFFLGLAYARQGRFDMARALWSGLLARTPADAQWRTRVEGALARVKQIETMERQNGRPGAEMPSNE
jgi:cytochrome c-type biogenesis protein CcmH